MGIPEAVDNFIQKGLEVDCNEDTKRINLLKEYHEILSDIYTSVADPDIIRKMKDIEEVI